VKTIWMIGVASLIALSAWSEVPVRAVRADSGEESASFTTGDICARCHDNSPRAEAMRDAGGRPIAPFDLWRSSMMANSARDPFWRAVVAAEVAATPSRRIAIEAKCARCHLPMARVPAGRAPTGHRDLSALLDCECDSSERARDGVSCTVCHQIRPEGLGSAGSFSGGFRIGEEAEAFGPHAHPFARPMIRHSGFHPVPSDHVRRSALCATCHTLETRTLSARGEPTGHRLMEQSPYLEWRNSRFNTEGGESDAGARSCQDCHVPTSDVDGRPVRTRLAHNPGGWDWPPLGDRSPYGRHVFVGGNVLMGQILRDHRRSLNVLAPAAAFDATVARTRARLSTRAATVSIPRILREGRQLRVAVAVVNRTGHKLPTGFPSRRMWIRFEALDRTGTVVFRSGAFDARGRILDPAGRVHAVERAGGPVLPHCREIRDGRDVQVYEALMEDGEGSRTFRLLRGARYGKDNRLLPQGWRDDHPAAARTAPAGVDGDPDFIGGSDRIDYVFAAPAGNGPYAIEVALYYQSLGTRFVNEVLAVDGPAIRRFERLHHAADPRPARLAVAEATAR
jgi:hypothetical protein